MASRIPITDPSEPLLTQKRLRTEGVHETSRSGISIPNGITYISVSASRLDVDSNSWPVINLEGPEGEVVDVVVEVTLDGTNWFVQGGFAAHGGDYISRTGLATESACHFWVPDGPGRRMRFSVTQKVDLVCQFTIFADERVRTERFTLPHNSVAYVTGGTIGSATNASSATTGAFTPSGSDTMLLGVGANSASSSVGTYTSISSSVDGALTQHWNQAFQTFFRQAGAYKVSPTASSQTVTYTIGGGNDDEVIVGAEVFSGVDQTTPLGTVSFTSGTTDNPSDTIASATDDMVINAIYGDQTSITANGGATERHVGTVGAAAMGISTEPGAASVSNGWTANYTYGWGMAVVNAAQASGAGTDNLLANDVESNSEVTSPSVGQVHAITANDVESNSELSSPAVGQVHALAAADAESNSELSAPALLEVTPITADDVESNSEVSAPSIGQVHALLANDVESNSELTSPSIGQVHGLTANDVESNSEVTSPAIDSALQAEAILSGGWTYFGQYEAELQRRRTREEKRKALLEELETIQDEASKEIASILHEQDDDQERKEEAKRLRALVETVSKEQIQREFGERVAKAYQRAYEKATYSALEALVREAKRAEEEEEFLMIALMAVH